MDSCSFRAWKAALPAALICVVAATMTTAEAQVTEIVLYSFSGGSDGGNPFAGVIADERGALYGTTIGGGISNTLCAGACGVAFKLTPVPPAKPPWVEMTLWRFSGGNDGATPFAGLFVPDESPSPKKTLYGTTSFNGAFGNGTVFRLLDGNLNTLWAFTGGSDGANPFGPVSAGENSGALYGTTEGGGASGNGTVFKIDMTDQTLTTVYGFLGGPDGATPGLGALLVDGTGALYGTTLLGGPSGNGTVFKLTPPRRGQTAWTEMVLWSFSGGSDGANPQAGLIADEVGALYGTTSAGGASAAGTVFKLTPPKYGQSAWTLTTLWSFSGGSDGGSPFSTLLADQKGALYGTTESGGATNSSGCPFGSGGCGVVFKLTPTASGQAPWAETVLWTFSGTTDGGTPDAGLIADNRGALYGTTEFGGTLNTPSCGIFGCGVVFKLTGTGFVPRNDDGDDREDQTHSSNGPGEERSTARLVVSQDHL